MGRSLQATPTPLAPPVNIAMSALSMISRRWATKKAGGSSRNGRDSQPKMLGVKKIGLNPQSGLPASSLTIHFAGGEQVEVGHIIIRQRGTKFRPGDNVGLGRDHTIFALTSGNVRFVWGGLRKQFTVNVVPHKKYGDLCCHRAFEAMAKDQCDRAMGFLGQAKFAYNLAKGEEKEEGLKYLAKAVTKIRETIAKKNLFLLGPCPSIGEMEKTVDATEKE
eukprot:756247-Hanusia_phi.AAC.4